jgi:uncharacterized protein
MNPHQVPHDIQNLWGHDGPYNDYGRYIRKIFGRRVQKISLDGGFSCPNRDGTLGYGGCTYCNGTSFVPSYLQEPLDSWDPHEKLLGQFNRGVEFFSRKYPNTGYAAYFQSYSSSYGSLDHLASLYQTMMAHPLVDCLILATRPDHVTQDLVSLLEQLKNQQGKPVFLELGVESVYDKTLLRVRRHHTLAQSQQALKLLEASSLPVFAHIIFGLPGETQSEMLGYLDFFQSHRVTGLKIHHLQVLRNTALAKEFLELDLWNLEAYLAFLTRFLSSLDPRVVVDRFINEAPLDEILAPRWGAGGVKNYAFVALLRKSLVQQGLYQGVYY